MSKNSKKILGILGVIALGGIGYHYWHRQQYFPTTDDAYIQANVINIAPRVPGAVTSVAVQNLQHVHAGQPLFSLDPEPYKLAVKQAQAQRDNAIQQMKAAMMEVASMEALVTERQAEWVQSQQNAKRVLALVQKKLYPPSEGDDATRQLNVSVAALSAAKSQLAEAQQKLGALGENNAQVQVATATLNQAELNLQ